MKHKPVAALSRIAMCERTHKLDKEFKILRKNMAENFSEKSEQQIESLVNKAIKATRKQDNKKRK